MRFCRARMTSSSPKPAPPEESIISSAGRYRHRQSRTPNPKKISDHTVNQTDPDACLAGHVKGTARMGYKGPLPGRLQ